MKDIGKLILLVCVFPLTASAQAADEPNGPEASGEEEGVDQNPHGNTMAESFFDAPKEVLASGIGIASRHASRLCDYVPDGLPPCAACPPPDEEASYGSMPIKYYRGNLYVGPPTAHDFGLMFGPYIPICLR